MEFLGWLLFGLVVGRSVSISSCDSSIFVTEAYSILKVGPGSVKRLRR